MAKKLDFPFGKATGSAHNVGRSEAMLKQLKSIGLDDTPEARKYLADLLQQAAKQPGVMQSNGRILRETLVMGPQGALKMQSIWEGDKLITIFLFGGK